MKKSQTIEPKIEPKNIVKPQYQYLKDVYEEKRKRKLQVGEKKTPFEQFDKKKDSDDDDIQDPEEEYIEPRPPLTTKSMQEFNRPSLSDSQLINQVIYKFKNEELDENADEQEILENLSKIQQQTQTLLQKIVEKEPKVK